MNIICSILAWMFLILICIGGLFVIIDGIFFGLFNKDIDASDNSKTNKSKADSL
jgi:hypothetical protein